MLTNQYDVHLLWGKKEIEIVFFDFTQYSIRPAPTVASLSHNSQTYIIRGHIFDTFKYLLKFALN